MFWVWGTKKEPDLSKMLETGMAGSQEDSQVIPGGLLAQATQSAGCEVL
jgi:hypothetical protein